MGPASGLGVRRRCRFWDPLSAGSKDETHGVTPAPHTEGRGDSWRRQSPAEEECWQVSEKSVPRPSGALPGDLAQSERWILTSSGGQKRRVYKEKGIGGGGKVWQRGLWFKEKAVPERYEWSPPRTRGLWSDSEQEQ